MVPHQVEGETPTLSPDGQYLAASENGQLCVTYLDSRAKTCFPSKLGPIRLPKWSPDGRFIVFSYVDLNFRTEKLAVLNWPGGRIEPLTGEMAFESQPSWTRDGKVAFISMSNNARALWLKDLISGRLTPIDFLLPGDAPIISPDGIKVAFSNNSDLLISTIGGTVATIRGSAPITAGSALWSGDGEKIAFICNIVGKEKGTFARQLYVADVAALTSTLVATSPGVIDHLAWSPGGEKLAYYTEQYQQASATWERAIWMAGSDGEATKVASPETTVSQLVWKAGDHLFVLAQSGYFEIKMGGTFSMAGIKLYTGENHLNAVARDRSGNQSQPSGSIIVRLETIPLPDLAIRTTDLWIYPPYPRPGENFLVGATVHNIGKLSATDIEVSISLQTSTGMVSEIGKVLLPTLAVGGGESVSLAFRAADQLGRNTIIVTADPRHKIDEISEENGSATKDFIITDREEIAMLTRLSAPSISSKQDLALEVAIDNSGKARQAILVSKIESGLGEVVAVLYNAQFDLLFGAQTLSFVWPPAGTFAGSYQVHTILREADGTLIAESRNPFEILSDLQIQATLTTDRKDYEANQQALITADLANLGTNAMISLLTAKIVVLDPGRKVVFEKEMELRFLLPGMRVQVPAVWAAALMPAGNYEVLLTAIGDGQVVASAKAGFQILAQPVVSGRITVASPLVPIGQRISAGYFVTNSGNVAASGILRMILIDADSGAVVDEQKREIVLPVGENHTGTFEISSEPLALKSYRISLQYLAQNNWKPLADTAVAVVDGTPPAIRIVEPSNGGIYNGAVEIVAEAGDNASEIARCEYRIDEGVWSEMPFIDAATGRYRALWEPALPDNGGHVITCRAIDGAGNWSAPVAVTFNVLMDNVQMDSTPPLTTVVVGSPSHTTPDGMIYVTGTTEFALTASDDFSGVARTDYRVDGGAWQLYTSPFILAGRPDGSHVISFSSVDHLGNQEDERSLAIMTDTGAPTTVITFEPSPFASDAERHSVGPETSVTLSAVDELSGVQATFYRFDGDPEWQLYSGLLRLAELVYGPHVLRYRSIDNTGNVEEEQSVILSLLGVEVATELLNRARVLVWTEDPAQGGGKVQPPYTLADIRALFAEAFGDPDIYATVITEKEEFRRLLRSGIYNSVMVIRQDIPLDTIFLREMREAVNRGTGLLVSHWGNSVPPLWQDLFGVDFKGALSMAEGERVLHLYAGPLGDDQVLSVFGRVLKTIRTDGTLAGIIPGESVCAGVRGLTLHHTVHLQPGDRVQASLSAFQGKKLVPIDEEQLVVNTLPVIAVNRFTGHGLGDLAFIDFTEDGITLSLGGADGYLEGSYSLLLNIEHPDGSSIITGPVSLTPTCSAELQAGMNLGPFRVMAVDEVRVRTGTDLPAVVLGRYGAGRTALLTYDLIASALSGQRSGHLALLNRAAAYLLPEVAPPEAGGLSLLETRIRQHGGGFALQAVDHLGEGLKHVPLFDLQGPLVYTFHLEDGEEAAWRYFVRFDDRQGDFTKTTAISLGRETGEVPFADYPSTFNVAADAHARLVKALEWVDAQIPLHPEAAEALGTIREDLIRIDSLPRTTPAETEPIIHDIVQTIHAAVQLGSDVSELRQWLDDYLRIVAGGEGVTP